MCSFCGERVEMVNHIIIKSTHWDLEIKTDHLTLTRRPELELKLTDKKLQFRDFAVMADNEVKIKVNKKIEKYLDLARELKKL